MSHSYAFMNSYICVHIVCCFTVSQVYHNIHMQFELTRVKEFNFNVDLLESTLKCQGLYVWRSNSPLGHIYLLNGDDIDFFFSFLKHK